MQEENVTGQASVDRKAYGVTTSGEKVDLFTLTNANGLSANIIEYGGTLTSLMVPDASGQLENVVLGLDSLEDYEACEAYLGALIGRSGNRIAKGRATVDGTTLDLPINNGPNHLHGGPKGFHKVVWSGKAHTDDVGAHLELRYRSVDGEEGYPGNLDVVVIYSLTNDDELRIDYQAQTDKPTICNLTHHSYFDLSGGSARSVLNTLLQLDATQFTPVDETLIPTGDLRDVEGTPFDFTELQPIGERISEDDEQLAYAGGYDHNFVLTAEPDEDGLRAAALVIDPDSGRAMEVLTTEPGMQFYSGNFLDGSLRGQGRVYRKRSGFCLETQGFPDSPNQPAFPTTILMPGDTYRSTTLYCFMTADESDDEDEGHDD
ncbi:aldose epimerase family protein [Parvularcula sp. LCG005]|uniref:aldose epimerase family protein n=1 Tax=Parvularcula sp. LCG005 TaxID=3078805 RepID=UPI00294282A8|nr:aldose epimerase family protein [Parvularcula sp. LCG005]WOI54568.1 aldose epimerase family protein [Parvularcula sp. LCG005]